MVCQLIHFLYSQTKSKPRKHKKSKMDSCWGEPEWGPTVSLWGQVWNPVPKQEVTQKWDKHLYPNPFEITSTFSNYYYISAVAICYVLVPKENRPNMATKLYYWDASFRALWGFTLEIPLGRLLVRVVRDSGNLAHPPVGRSQSPDDPIAVRK